MRRYRVLCMIIALLFLGAVIVVNISLQAEREQLDRPYMVEIAGLAERMNAEGSASFDETGEGNLPERNGCRYVTAVIPCEKESDLVAAGTEDYCIREVNGQLYRFEYRTGSNRTRMTVIVNAVLTGIGLLLFGVLFYVGAKIIAPFHRLEQVPGELAKGNLSTPIPEDRNKFFHRFIWGTNMLRESLEERRERELEMHRDKKMLLLSLTHDIKTPLSVIKLNVQALQKKLYRDEERRGRALTDISGKVDEIERYVTQIVAASREDFLDLTVREEEFYLSDLLRRVRDYYSPRLELRKTEFRIEEYRDCLLAGDEARLEEVLQNIIENAVKYGDGERIRIETGREDGCVLISVANTGEALGQDEMWKLFDSFYRGSNVGRQPGSGLGLYICRRLMANMNGDIFARYRDGEFIMTVVVRMS